MNTLEIRRVAKSHSKLKKYFQGVCALDQIPKITSRYPEKIAPPPGVRMVVLADLKCKFDGAIVFRK
jgi:hypothetical protein